MSGPASRRAAGRLLLAAGLSGAAVMIIELSAARAIGPWFGTSLYTWTNVIGVVLLALSAGYVLGGRLADRHPDPRRLGVLLLLAAGLSLPAPFLAGPLSELLLPEPAALSPLVATAHVVRGSLAVSLLLFAPPILLMGMVGPYVTRGLVDLGLGSGRAAGRTLAVSTLGSLVGTYLPAHILIEWVGVRATLLVAAGLLAVAGLLLVSVRRRIVAAGLLVIVAGAAVGVRELPIRGSVRGDATAREVAVLEEYESPYQYLRVSSWDVERAGGTQRQLRLSLDEGVLEYHSLREEAAGEAAFLTGGSYYDHYGLLPALVARTREDPADVAILGGGAGTMARMLRVLQGDRVGRIVNVEIDPMVASLSSTFGWTPGAEDLLLVGDARCVLAALDHRFDVIILDAYARQVAIPAHLGSREFFEMVRDHLSERGVFAMNVSTHDLETPLMRALRRTLGEVFPSLAAVSVPGSWNVVLLAAPDAERDFRPDVVASPGLSAVRDTFLSGLIPLPPAPSGLRLTDDAAPLEQLARSR